MSVLRFKAEGVRALVEHAKAAPEHTLTYGQEQQKAKPEPGLLLVGDQGVYLLSNGRPVDHEKMMVYAEGINPKVDEFDDWWAAKRATFGGDDGVDFIGLVGVEAALANPAAEWLEVEITADVIEIVVSKVLK